MLNTEQLLSHLTEAVSYTYRKDATSPGVLVSSLKDGTIYASIVRYGNSFPKGKKVVCKANGQAIGTVIIKLTGEFLAQVGLEKNPVDSLRELVSTKNS